MVITIKKKIQTFCEVKQLSTAKHKFDINDDLFNRDVSSVDNNLACNEFLDTCKASPKSIDENRQRRK